MRIFSYFFLFIVVLLGFTFAVLNAEPVNLNYYVGARSISLSLLLVLCVGIGVLVGLLITFVSIIRVKRENRQLKNALKSLEKTTAV